MTAPTPTEAPRLPEPDLEGVDYELWGQNAKADCWFREKMLAFRAEGVAERDSYWREPYEETHAKMMEAFEKRNNMRDERNAARKEAEELREAKGEWQAECANRNVEIGHLTRDRDRLESQLAEYMRAANSAEIEVDRLRAELEALKDGRSSRTLEISRVSGFVVRNDQTGGIDEDFVAEADEQYCSPLIDGWSWHPVDRVFYAEGPAAQPAAQPLDEAEERRLFEAALKRMPDWAPEFEIHRAWVEAYAWFVWQAARARLSRQAKEG